MILIEDKDMKFGIGDKLWKYQKQKLRLFVFPKAWIFIQKIVCNGLITIISFAEKEITKLIGGKNLCHEE